jgi:hypothetical protein
MKNLVLILLELAIKVSPGKLGDRFLLPIIERLRWMEKFIVDLCAEVVRNPDIREFLLELSERVTDRVVDGLTPDLLPGGLVDTVKKWLHL